MDELELDEAVCSGPLAMESCEADSKLKLWTKVSKLGYAVVSKPCAEVLDSMLWPYFRGSATVTFPASCLECCEAEGWELSTVAEKDLKLDLT